MYLFSSKKGAGRSRGGSPAPRTQACTDLAARPSTRDERRSWMDSSQDLKQGLDVVELDELPGDLFGVPPAPR